MDSFRVVRYEIEMENPCYESKKILLRQRHRAAPGTVLVSKPTADLSKSCMLCKVHAFMVPTGWQQQAPLHYFPLMSKHSCKSIKSIKSRKYKREL